MWMKLTAAPVHHVHKLLIVEGELCDFTNDVLECRVLREDGRPDPVH